MRGKPAADFKKLFTQQPLITLTFTENTSSIQQEGIRAFYPLGVLGHFRLYINRSNISKYIYIYYSQKKLKHFEIITNAELF